MASECEACLLVCGRGPQALLPCYLTSLPTAGAALTLGDGGKEVVLSAMTRFPTSLEIQLSAVEVLAAAGGASHIACILTYFWVSCGYVNACTCAVGAFGGCDVKYYWHFRPFSIPR